MKIRIKYEEGGWKGESFSCSFIVYELDNLFCETLRDNPHKQSRACTCSTPSLLTPPYGQAAIEGQLYARLAIAF